MTEVGLPKALFYAFLSIGMGLLAIDFIFVYIPLSGWVLQSILVGVYLEYLKPKKTLVLISIIEIFFLISYGGSVAIAAILTLFGVQLFLPVIIGAYFGLIASVYMLGYIANRLFHKIHLFERLSKDETHSKIN
jgi:hypothetical protein